MPAAIEVTNVSKRYARGQRRAQSTGVSAILREVAPWAPVERELLESEFWAVRDVSFAVEPGDALGVLGRNGAGKSTLMRMLAGITKPTTGEVVVNGRVGALLDPNAGFDPVLTGRENVEVIYSLNAGHRPSRDTVDAIVAYAGVADVASAPVRTYSRGMRLRLGFATMIHVDPDVFVIDEALAVGDTSFQLMCLQQLHSFRQAGGAVVFVSHSLWLFQHLASRGLHLSGGEIQLLGDPAEVADQYLGELQAGSWVDSEGGPDILDRERPAAPEAEEDAELDDPEDGGPDPDGAPRRPVVVRSIRSSDGDGGPVVSGSPLVLEIALRSRQAVPAAELAITIWTGDLSVCVAGDLSSDEEGARRPPDIALATGPSELRYRVASVPLAPGRYAVRLAVYDRATSDVLGLHGYEDACSWLEVASPPAEDRDRGGPAGSSPQLRPLRIIEVVPR